jgi:hypothetical protein
MNMEQWWNYIFAGETEVLKNMGPAVVAVTVRRKPVLL